MSIDAASRARLARVLSAARLPAAAAPVLLPSDSDDVWRIGPIVLRVCWRGRPEAFHPRSGGDPSALLEIAQTRRQRQLIRAEEHVDLPRAERRRRDRFGPSSSYADTFVS